MYGYGAVKAAVVRSREAECLPRTIYRKEPGREVFSLWYDTEKEARDAVIEARSMSGKQEAAA
jgi:hypothetical protein